MPPLPQESAASWEVALAPEGAVLRARRPPGPQSPIASPGARGCPSFSSGDIPPGSAPSELAKCCPLRRSQSRSRCLEPLGEPVAEEHPGGGSLELRSPSVSGAGAGPAGAGRSGERRRVHWPQGLAAGRGQSAAPPHGCRSLSPGAQSANKCSAAAPAGSNLRGAAERPCSSRTRGPRLRPP